MIGVCGQREREREREREERERERALRRGSKDCFLCVCCGCVFVVASFLLICVCASVCFRNTNNHKACPHRILHLKRICLF